jgi:predicted membrane protein (TIGR00267 family)
MKDAMEKIIQNIPRTNLDDKRFHIHIDPNKKASSLSDIILGGQDGLVNVLGVILGVAAATNDPRIVLVAGLAATFAESVSMGAVAYTSTLADSDFYESERAREYRHIKEVPHLEREEVKTIYQEKGFHGELLDRIVKTITENQDIWVAVMMAEEHRLTPTDRSHSIKAAVIVFLAALVGSLIPLAPFFIFPVGLSMILSIVITALVLYIVGVYKARITVGKPWKSGLEMAVIGTISALVGYAVGALLKVPTVP